MINQKCINCGVEDGFMEFALYHHSKKRVFCSTKCFREWVVLCFDKQKKGTFAWAQVQLKKGRKVRRPCWMDDSYWILGIDESIQWNGVKSAHIHLNQINAIDFEIYKETYTTQRLVDMFTQDLQNLINYVNANKNRSIVRKIINKQVSRKVKK